MEAIRLKRFKGFEDSNWIILRKLNLLFGLNSSGKTSILSALLFLKQSLETPALEIPFTFSSKKGVDIGTYEEVVFNHKIDNKNPVEIWMKLSPMEDFRTKSGQVIKGKGLIFVIKIGFNKTRGTTYVLSCSLLTSDHKEVFTVQRNPQNMYESFHSAIFNGIPRTGINIEWYNFIPVVKDLGNHIISKITEKVRYNLVEFFSNLAHVGPLRMEVERLYQFTGESPEEVGRQGEDALKLLYLDRHSKSRELTNTVIGWLRKYNYEFDWDTFSGYFKMVLKDTRTGVKVNIKDVGFGISQILPIIIQGYFNKRGQTVLIEQPEIHLHPGAQAELGDLFIDMASNSQKIFLIETHSEHMLLRLRRRIAETRLYGDAVDFALDNEDLSVYFIENGRNGSQVHLLGISDTGEFSDVPEAFRSFFADDFEETIKISQAIGRIKASQKGSGMNDRDN